MPNNKYWGIPGQWAYDGNCCYDNNNKCYCADCFYYGPDYTNCVIPTASNPPLKWNGTTWVLDV